MVEKSLDQIAERVIKSGEVKALLRALIAKDYGIEVLGNDVGGLALENFQRKRARDPKYPNGWLT